MHCGTTSSYQPAAISNTVISIPTAFVPLVSKLVDWHLMALSAQTGYIVPQEYEIYHIGPGTGTRQTHNKTMKQYILSLFILTAIFQVNLG